MSESLRDQLLKSGLVKKIKTQAPPAHDKSGHGTRPPKPPQAAASAKGKPTPMHGSAREPDLAHLYALRARQEKQERDAVQREAEQVAKEKRERKQKLTQLLAGKALNAADADVPRHFPHGNKIRRIYCTPTQLAELNRGELAVVQLAGRYLLVVRDIAVQAQAIDEQTLVLLCDPSAPTEDDVPADLVW
ncbi:MAG: DUF2058 family protein [Proteobacteria bacterium]|nr:DUF2058 family protein [Pseudomonadota bacterium]